MKLVFSAVVTVVLLVIYVYLVVYGIEIAQCVSDSACTTLTKTDFNDRMASSLALIGGLVAALVIAELAVTNPGQAPAARLVAPEVAEKRKGLMQIITGLYLLVWLLTGLSAFFFGYLTVEPDALPPLADLGQAWLGIAVGAGYAYFGIKQP
jgi:hypothetical protein